MRLRKPFSAVKVNIDDVYTVHSENFVKEACIFLDNMLEDISGLEKPPTGSPLLTPLPGMQKFITDWLLKNVSPMQTEF